MRATIALTLLALGCVCESSTYAATITFGSGDNMFGIEFVTIGNPGNPVDTTGLPNPAGSVGYTYGIGKFEISVQMIDKANSAAGLGIDFPFIPNGSDTAANFVSWYEAARFVNWLNTSTGHHSAYKFAAQPGDTGYSATALNELWTITDAGYDPNNLFRNSLARYFLPSIHEWYKAAYYDPISGVYFDYPTGSDSAPDGIDFVGDPFFDAVFKEFFSTTSPPGPYDITNVGVLSPYGTAGQGGNVQEWAETEADLTNDNTSEYSFRLAPGGDFRNSRELLMSSAGWTIFATDQYSNVGFRVASKIPEPRSYLLVAMAAAVLTTRRRIARQRE